jgi:hypothetical protein
MSHASVPWRALFLGNGLNYARRMLRQGYRPSGVVLASPPKRPAPVGSVNDDPLIRAGRIAWKRVREAGAQTFDSWICIGRALCACRRIAMKTSKMTKPFGGAFNRAMGTLLKEHGFDAIDPATRSEAAWLVANLQEVIEWRDSLPEYRRIALNSPGHVKRQFLASQKGSVRPPGPRRLRRPIDMLVEGVEALRPYMPGRDAATIEQAVLAVWQARGLRIPRSVVQIAQLLPVVSSEEVVDAPRSL